MILSVTVLDADTFPWWWLQISHLNVLQICYVVVVRLCVTSSRSPRRHSPSRSRRSRSGSGSRSRRSRFHRSRSRSRDRRSRDWRSPRSRSEERREREKERERRQKGLPPLKSKTLSGEYSLLQHVTFWYFVFVEKQFNSIETMALLWILRFFCYFHLVVCSTTLWVGQLDKKTTQQDISSLLEEFGQIESINVSLTVCLRIRCWECACFFFDTTNSHTQPHREWKLYMQPWPVGLGIGLVTEGWPVWISATLPCSLGAAVRFHLTVCSLCSRLKLFICQMHKCTYSNTEQ